jgi:hypothetical protein
MILQLGNVGRSAVRRELTVISDEPALLGQILLDPEIASIWRSGAGQHLLCRGGVIGRAPAGVQLLPYNLADLVTTARARLADHSTVVVKGWHISHASPTVGERVTDHIERIRAAARRDRTAPLPPAPRWGTAWIGTHSHRPGRFGVSLELSLADTMLAGVNGPDDTTWDDALAWAREFAEVICTRYPDGVLHRLTNPPPNDTALQEFTELGHFVWPNDTHVVPTAPDRLVIHAFPNEPSVNWLGERLAELVRAGTLPGVKDVVDTTGAARLLRLDVVLEPDADPQPVLDTIDELLSDLSTLNDGP